VGLGPQIQLRQSQQLVMTPQLTQAIKLLTLSNLELESVIAEEVAKNPLLEMGSNEDSEGVAEPQEREAPSLTDELIPGASEESQPLDYDFESQALETDSFTDVPVSSSGGEEFDFDRIEACETSLCEHLMAQLRGSSGPEAMLAAIIVQQLDENGYLTTLLAEIAEDSGATIKEAQDALTLVQGLDPPGVGARGLAECLALQAKAADRYDPAMARLIDNLHLLAKGRMNDLKRICGVDDEDLADMVSELRAYDPKPGSQFSSEGAEQVTPDVFVRHTRSGYSVELNSSALPRLLVNRRYYQELRTGPQDKSSRAWLSECLASANWLVRALDQRARTIIKVVSEIVKTQQGFFERGAEALKPLTLRQVAEAIDMHESTVSRVTSNKYLLCDRGLFELKYFFSSGVASSNGEGEGASAIAALLKQRGFDCARRTVVKYRESMGIGSSVQRRRQRKITGMM
jgi:RNA polymerase sigma-54 factor